MKYGVRLEGDPKHVDILVKERDFDFANRFGTPMTEESASSAGDGASTGRRARRAISCINFMAQNRPDLSSAARVVSQHMSSQTIGTLEAVKRIIFLHQEVSEIPAERQELRRGYHTFS